METKELNELFNKHYDDKQLRHQIKNIKILSYDTYIDEDKCIIHLQVIKGIGRFKTDAYIIRFLEKDDEHGYTKRLSLMKAFNNTDKLNEYIEKLKNGGADNGSK